MGEEEEEKEEVMLPSLQILFIPGKAPVRTLCFPPMPIPFVFHSTSFGISAPLPQEQVQLSSQMFPFATIGETRGKG